MSKEMVEGLCQDFADGRIDAIAPKLHDDFVLEWPQSGERVRGVANWQGVHEHRPGGIPTIKVGRTIGAGDVWVSESTVDYGDGKTWYRTSIFELKDGKIWRETDFFAQPFEAPEWRSKWVERM